AGLLGARLDPAQLADAHVGDGGLDHEAGELGDAPAHQHALRLFDELVVLGEIDLRNVAHGYFGSFFAESGISTFASIVYWVLSWASMVPNSVCTMQPPG